MLLRIVFFFALLPLGLLSQTLPFNLIPQPKKASLNAGTFTLSKDLTIHCSSTCTDDAQFFVDFLSQATGIAFELSSASPQPDKPFIFFSAKQTHTPELSAQPADPTNPKVSSSLEAYTLTVDPRAILVESPTSAGVYYAIQTLLQMLPTSAWTKNMPLPFQLPCLRIEDEPRFAHRGMLLDCCRHFMSKEVVKKYIDLLAMHKMNVLHWHLTEDQGWRVEIKKHPLLTEVGAYRTESDGTVYGGFYTQEDIREIVTYATLRHVTIIPEIEMPGHCSAALAAYPHVSCTGKSIPVENQWGVFKDIYCAGNDSTFAFLEDVLSEICDLFPSPFIHIGGDEAPKFRWENCSKCQARMKAEKLDHETQLQTYFINRMASFLATKNKTIIGWDEIIEGGIPHQAIVQCWRGSEFSKEAALHQHYSILSPTSHCYFDYGLESIDLEKVYSFDPLQAMDADSLSQFVLGGECNMWTEHAPQEKIDQKMFPRLLAFSEVMWSYPNKRDYSAFFQRVKKHEPRLESKNVDMGWPCIPLSFSDSLTPSGEIMVQAIPAFQDIEVTYQSTSQPKSRSYTEPIRVEKGKRELLSFSAKEGQNKYTLPLQRTYEAHSAVNSTLLLNYAVNTYYPAGGEKALVDGRIGSDQFRDGAWQGVSGKDMEITIDRGTDTLFSSFETSFYHYANAWIFRPERLVVSISSDGKKWTPWTTIEASVELNSSLQGPVTYSHSAAPTSARHIRVRAESILICPEWHDAPGEPSWLFCDELIIRP